MKAKRHTEEQIIAVLRESEAGAKTKELCRKYGISEPTSECSYKRSSRLRPARGVQMTTPGSNAVSQGSDDVAYLCRLPRIFRGGTESARNLVHKSRTDPRLITVEAVKAVLDANPGLIDDWQRWSEDKRVSSGWYLGYENGSHIVGRYPSGDQSSRGAAAAPVASLGKRTLIAMDANNTPLASNAELHQYLQQTADTFAELGRHAAAKKLRSAAAQAAGLSTEFLGESRNTLAEVLRSEGSAMPPAERDCLVAIINQLNKTLQR